MKRIEAIVHAGEVVLQPDFIDALPRLKVIACVSVGYDGVNVPRARARGVEAVSVFGDPGYYGRFGFRRLADVRMPPPTNPDRVLGFELVPGAWAGVAGPVEKAQPPFTAG